MMNRKHRIRDMVAGGLLTALGLAVQYMMLPPRAPAWAPTRARLRRYIWTSWTIFPGQKEGTSTQAPRRTTT